MNAAPRQLACLVDVKRRRRGDDGDVDLFRQRLLHIKKGRLDAIALGDEPAALRLLLDEDDVGAAGRLEAAQMPLADGADADDQHAMTHRCHFPRRLSKLKPSGVKRFWMSSRAVLTMTMSAPLARKRA